MKKPPKNHKFSQTEVGTLIEQLRSEFKIFGEDLISVKSDVKSVKDQVGKNTEKLAVIETALITLKDQVGKNTEEIRLNRELINRVLEELKSKVDRKDFQLLEKKVNSLTT